MNNDDDVDTDEDNCDMDYKATDNLISKIAEAKVYLHREQSAHSTCPVAQLNAHEGTLNHENAIAMILERTRIY
jgi:hypothetical protein